MDELRYRLQHQDREHNLDDGRERKRMQRCPGAAAAGGSSTNSVGEEPNDT